MAILCFQLKQKFIGTLIVLSCFTTACGESVQESSQPQAISVKLEEIETDNLQESDRFVGTLEARQRVILASRVDGRILNIAVSEGDRVKQGQLIIQLQQTREQEEVNSAVSNVNIQRANLDNAEASLRAVEAEVASAEANVQQAKADLREQEAELELAKTNIERTQFLVEEGAQSKQTLDDRTRDLNAAIAQRDALKEALNSSEKALIAAKARVRASVSAVDREKAALSQAQAQVGVASQNLDFNRITAPIDGVVGDIVPKVGDYVDTGDELTTITQNNILDLNISVPIERLSQLKLELPVEIINAQEKNNITGKISFISPRVNRSEQTILAKATFPNNGSLKDDQFVRARIIWQDEPGVLIPTEAVSRIGGQNFVFVAEEQTSEDGKAILIAKQKAVVLGDIQGQSYQVISGVEAGDKLVVSGILNLSDGVTITAESLAINK
ncbi:MAG: efflux RND transporter periplasmic adaptor subunit [Xenococcaceae cyanobacterium MO_188.B29]|nr:efflux RND transporter periplasmic adaptor subunit [Xenococcaceae cyanobacterium MO_188.B29]